MTGPTDPDRDDDALAAEYALGLLDGAEREAFEARLLTDPVLRERLAHWHETLAPMAEAVAPAAPRAAVKVRVMDVVWGGAAPRRGGLWRSLGLWRLSTLAASAAAAGFAAVLWLTPPEAPGPLLVVNITAQDGSLQILAAASSDSDSLRLARQAGSAAPGRVLELWAIAGDSAPVSLGVLPEDGEAVIELPEQLRDALPELILAVSDEPVGGSPTGQPTGAVLAAGQVQTF